MEIVKSERPPKSKPEIILATTAKHLDNHAKVNADIHPKIGGGGSPEVPAQKGDSHFSDTTYPKQFGNTASYLGDKERQIIN